MLGGRGRGREGKRRREAEDERMLTLHLLVQAFIGATVTVDCKDGAAATGTVVSADCDMK